MAVAVPVGHKLPPTLHMHSPTFYFFADLQPAHLAVVIYKKMWVLKIPLKYPYRDWIEAVTNSLNIPTFSPQAKYITEAEKKYNILLKSLDPQLSLNYQKRCEEATKEGGKISGHRLGVWSIPPVIVDEELYRTNFLSSR
ncbi:hypothetical protein CJ030_MR6G024472 [Morella rubra]|uniref:Uncharacterized protein n=1 Tax=Morella rubra TaxID=262757 RepID=A0A6A1VDE8_9ROSI|nr:hypothetical protein CJ030_MR6G024472 [Morella rubra]